MSYLYGTERVALASVCMGRMVASVESLALANPSFVSEGCVRLHLDVSWGSRMQRHPAFASSTCHACLTWVIYIERGDREPSEIGSMKFWTGPPMEVRSES